MFQLFALTLCTLLCCGPWLGTDPAAWLTELCSCCWIPVALVPGSRCQYTRMKRLFRTASVLDMARLASSFFVYWINAASGSPPNTTWRLGTSIWWNKFFMLNIELFISSFSKRFFNSQFWTTMILIYIYQDDPVSKKNCSPFAGFLSALHQIMHFTWILTMVPNLLKCSLSLVMLLSSRGILRTSSLVFT